jgi:hypothetical protein
MSPDDMAIQLGNRSPTRAATDKHCMLNAVKWGIAANILD